MSPEIKGDPSKHPQSPESLNPGYWLAVAAVLFVLAIWGAFWQPVAHDAYGPASWRDLFYPSETHPWRRLPALHSRINGSYALGDGKHFWAVGDNGLILYSDDAGKTWQAGQFDKSATLPASLANLFGIVGNAWAEMAPKDYSNQAPRPIDTSTINSLDVDANRLKSASKSTEQPAIEAPANSPAPLEAKAQSKASAKAGLIKNVETSKNPIKPKTPTAPLPKAATVTPQPSLPAITPASATKQSDNFKQHLRAVFFIDENHGWAVGNNGTIIASDDGGRHWQRQSNPSTADLLAVQFADAQHGWAVGGFGTIIATNDGGRNWLAQPSNTDQGLNGVAVIDADRGWAVGDSGIVVATNNGGRNWQIQSGNTDSNLTGVHFIDARHGWAVGIGTIVATADGGLHWQQQTSNTQAFLNTLYFADADHGWAAGDGAIVVTVDGGQHWQPPADNTYGARFNSIRFSDNEHGWAVESNGRIFSTADGGQHWHPQTNNSQLWLSNIFFLDQSRGWAIGEEGLILATDDGGRHWQPQLSNTMAALNAIHFVDPRHGWAAGRNGTIVATTDGGRRWQAQASNTQAWLNGIQFVDDRRGWAVGSDGIILATSDGGSHWLTQTSNTKAWLNDIQFLDEDRGWAAGNNGSIVATEDGGRHWQSQISTTPAWLTALHFTDQLHGTATTSDGAILSTANGGQLWQPQFKSQPAMFFGLHFADNRYGWVVGGNGDILATSDGGQHWQYQISATSATLRGVFFSDFNHGWAVGNGGIMLATDDGGQHWRQALPYRKSPGFWVYPLLLLAGALAIMAGYRKLQQPTSDRAGSGIMDRAISDKPAGDKDGGSPDLLGARVLAAGLVRFLSNRNTLPPITLAITGEWGSGKSSVMNYLSNGLRRNGLTPLWFNAWHHREEQNVLASIFSSLHQQVVGPWWTPRGIWFRLRLLWHRGLLAKTVLSAMAFCLLFSITWLSGHPSERSKVWHYLQYQVGYIEPVLLSEDALDQLCQTPPAVVSQITTKTTTQKSPATANKSPAEIKIEDVSKQESRHEPAKALFDKTQCDRLRDSRLLAGSSVTLEDCLAPANIAQSGYCFARPGELAEQVEKRLNLHLTVEERQNLLAAASHVQPAFPLPTASKWLSGLLALIGVLVVKAMALVGVAPVKLMQSAMAFADGAASAGEAIGTRVIFDKHFKGITRVLGKRRLVLFIDDLDRCDSEHTKRVLEVSNFLSSAGDLFIILGMAPRYVMANVTLCYQAMANAVQEVDAMNGQIAAQGGSSGQSWFARHFLQKLIQIEVPVPEPQPQQVLALLTGETDDAGLNQAVRDLNTKLAQEERDEQQLHKVLSGLSAILTWLILLAALATGAFYGARWQPDSHPLLAAAPDDKPLVAQAPSNAALPADSTTPAIKATPTADERGPSFEAGQTAEGATTWPTLILAAILLALIGLSTWLVSEPQRLNSPALSWLRPMLQRLKIRLFGPEITLDSNDFADALKIWYPLIAMANPIPRNVKTFVNQLRYYASRRNPTGIVDGQEAQLVAMAVAYYAFGDDMPMLFDIAVDRENQQQFLKEKMAELNQLQNGLLLTAVSQHLQRFQRLPTAAECRLFMENHKLITIQRRNTVFEKSGQ